MGDLTPSCACDPIMCLHCESAPAGCKAAVALANKNARILWAVMTKGEAFDARHVSVKPGAPTTSAAPA